MIGLAIRTVLALAVVGWAVPAYRYAEVATLRANAPLEAAKIAPQDAKALANALGGRFDSNPEFKPSAGDLVDIRAALRSQPLEPKLLSIMGLAYEVSGDTNRAAETMRVAYLVSRRENISGLYLIESASAAGDVKATLAHYNAVLLTQPELNPVLLPILSSALAYPEVRTQLRPYLQAGAKWVPTFLTVAAEKGSVTDLQALLIPLPKALLREEYAPIMASVLHRLAIEADQASARRFAAAVIPGLPLNSLSSMSIDSTTLDKRIGQFSWTFPYVEGILVEITEDKSLQIKADPLAHGAVAIRDLILDAGGKYQLFQRFEYGSGSSRINARWSADCINPGGTSRFWEERLPTSEAKGSSRSELVIPQDCKIVRMVLYAEGPDGQMPSTLAVGGVLLSKIN